MRKKSLMVLTVSLSALFFFTVGSLTATDAPETITMDSKIFKKHTKGLVEFSHKKHTEHKGVSCTECHHIYKDGKNIWKEGDPVQKCDECHKGTGKIPKEIKKADIIKNFYKEALHENCKGCHKKMVDKKGDIGKKLNKCDGCHPKKK
jgi:hypothetical protein